MADPSLFGSVDERHTPLAHRMRPEKLEAFLGQGHLLGPGKPLRDTIERGAVGSMVFWGPPGSGKTTLARLVANYTDRAFAALRHLMLKNFSAPRSAPKPASVTT